MKWRNNLYFRVVNRRRLDLNVGSRRQPAEKIHHPAAPHHRQSLFPCSRVSSRFHHRIRPTALIGQCPHRSSHISGLRDINRRHSAQLPSHRQWPGASRQRNHAHSPPRQHSHEQQSNPAASDHHRRIAPPHFHFVHSAQYAFHWLHQRPRMIAHSVRTVH